MRDPLTPHLLLEGRGHINPIEVVSARETDVRDILEGSGPAEDRQSVTGRRTVQRQTGQMERHPEIRYLGNATTATLL